MKKPFTYLKPKTSEEAKIELLKKSDYELKMLFQSISEINKIPIAELLEIRGESNWLKDEGWYVIYKRHIRKHINRRKNY